MSSPEPNDFLSAFHDGETAAGESAVAREFVQRSPEAAREIKEYERLAGLLRELPRVALPPEFAASVLQQAERESLIPLEPITQNSAAQNPASGQAVPQPSGSSRRRWILVSAITGAIAATLVISFGLVNPHKQRGPEAIAIRESLPSDSTPVRGQATPAPAAPALAKAESKVATSELDRRGLQSKSDDNLLTPALKSPTASPSPAAGEREAVPLGLASPKMAKSTVNEPSSSSQQSLLPQQDVGLVLPANLKTAQVGDVVEALQQDGKQVAVVRLTVVNQVEALDGVQSLLVQNTRQILQNVDEIKRMRQRFAAGKAADVPKEALPSAPGDMICVYAEGSRAEMQKVLQGLQSERHIQEAEWTNTIPFEVLEEFANSAVPAKQQKGGLSASQKQEANKAVVAGRNATGSRLAVSLPAATVDKIMSRGQPASVRNRRKGNSPTESQFGQQRQAKSQPVSRSDDLQVAKDGAYDSKGTPGQAATSRRGSRTRSQTIAKNEQRRESRDLDDADAAQQSFQIFFVITDQSQVQTQPQTPGQSKVGVGVQSGPQSVIVPRVAAPASQGPKSAKQAAPNKSP